MEIKIFRKTDLLVFVFLLLSIPKFSLAASLYIQPSSKTLNVGDNLIVTIYIDAPDQTINAASGRIVWDNNILKYISHSKSETIFNFWVREPDVFINELVFEGVVFNPGFQGRGGKILTITFQAVKPGETKIDFISGMILANDGMGTNILGAMIGGNYKITQTRQQEKIIIQEESILSKLPSKPVIISPTHPDQNKWYNNKNPIFEWKIPLNVSVVITGYNENPDLLPTVKYIPPISKKELKNIPDGSYYFAVQFGNEFGKSEISRFRFNIDTKPPKITEFSLTPKKTALYLKVIATDTLSGLDKAEIYIDDVLYSRDDFLNDRIEKLISGLEGAIKIKIIIKDKANNETVYEETAIIEKEKLEIRWLILLIFIVLVLIIILMLRIEKTNKHIRNIQKIEFKEKTKNIFDEFIKTMKEEIRNLDQDSGFSEKERSIYRRFKEIIEKAEKEFEKYLKKEKEL